MSNHDDELNRLLDALASEDTAPEIDLDAESIAAAGRFMAHANDYQATAEFSDRLGAMLSHVKPVPALAGRRIEHIGEGVGLVLPMPAPRSFRLMRVAAIAAVALLMIAIGGFYRSSSDNGGNLIFAPVASASPAPEQACTGDAPAQATVEANRTARDYPLLLTSYGVQRFHKEFPAKPFSYWPESMLPVGPNADEATLAELEPIVKRDLYCAGRQEDAYGQPTNVQIVSSVAFDDGRVGLLVKTDISDFPITEFLVYAKGPSDWYLLQWTATLPDDQLAASATIHAQDNWTLQFYDFSGAMNGGAVSVLGVSYSIFEMRVHANQAATINVQNIGKIAGRFQIPDAGIDQTIEPGEKTTVSVTLTAGWHHFTTTIDGVPGGGFIYAEPSLTEATPLTSTCNQVDIGFPAMDNLMNSEATKIRQVVIRPASYDPSVPYGVIAIEDIPAGFEPDAAVDTAIRQAIANETACRNAGLSSVVPTVSDYYAALAAEAQGTPRSALPTATAVGIVGSKPAAMPDILEIRQFDATTVGVLTASSVDYPDFQHFTYYALSDGTWVPVNAIFAAPAGWIASTIPGEPVTTLSGRGWDDSFTNFDSASSYFPYEAIVVGSQPVTIELSNPGKATIRLEIEGSGQSVTLKPGTSEIRTITLAPGTYRTAMYADDVLVARGFLYVTSPPPASATPVS